jgi:hypothetical protein
MNYIEIDGYANNEVIDCILKKFSNIYESHGYKGIFVNKDDIKIFTINGMNLLYNIPEVLTLYNYSYDYIKKNYYENLEHINEVDIAISANVLSYEKTDKFRMHFDRNQVTCIIYLSDNPMMPLKLYPNVRPDPIINGKVEFELSKNEPITIKPIKNKALIFNGNRTFHGVELQTIDNEVVFNDLRYSLQFAFNLLKNINYTKGDYYGR